MNMLQKTSSEIMVLSTFQSINGLLEFVYYIVEFPGRKFISAVIVRYTEW